MNEINVNLGMAGLYRWEAVNKFSGRRRVLQDWSNNTLLLNGMNQMALFDFVTAVQVGVDGTPPLNTDTGLLGYSAGTTDLQELTWGAQPTADFYGWKRWRFRFPPGATGTNLSEALAGWSPLSGAFGISRALIIDPVTQTPVTISPLPDEYLDLLYELRYYPPLTDSLGVVNLNGVDYNTITRAALVTNAFWGERIGQKIDAWAVTDADWSAYDGDIGTIEQGPNGLSEAADNNDMFALGYQNNSFQVGVQANVGPNGWNLGLGIRSIRIFTTAGIYQTQFNAVSDGSRIPKTTDFLMQMVWNINWAEVTP